MSIPITLQLSKYWSDVGLNLKKKKEEEDERKKKKTFGVLNRFYFNRTQVIYMYMLQMVSSKRI